MNTLRIVRRRAVAVSMPTEVPLTSRPIEPFRDLLSAERWAGFQGAMRGGCAAFAARPIWCVNSTASGGGVAELLRTMLSYVAGAGIEAHWAVISGDAEFFAITKRIHNFIHGSAGDGGSLGDDERQTYGQVLAANLSGLLNLIAPQSVVLLHDPQTAGLVRPLQQHGCTVVWRSHIGALRSNAHVDAAWAFIEPHVRDADLLVFSHRNYVPAILADAPTAIVAPSIDPFSPKNTELAPPTVHAILVAAGLLAGAPPSTAPDFHRFPGQMSEVHNRADLLDGGPAPEASRPLLLQVSRWDRLKDHLGVLQGFAHRTWADTDADLMLAGPETGSVADDPEAKQVLRELLAQHAHLPERIRRRVHIASLPTADRDENAAIVNALQRHATIVVQKSIEEGFGLTVTEAMWKRRPVIASAVGGICEQVSNQRTGVLLADPYDLDGFGDAITELLSDPDHARELAAAGRASALNNFLHDRHLRQYAELLGAPGPAKSP
jgi:trehalose synthase